MTTRQPSHPLRRTLLALHASQRRALAIRFAVRATAVATAVIAVAVVAGVIVMGGETFAWTRTLLVLAGIGVALVLAVRRYRAQAPAFDVMLERLEHRFPELRSWLRNALDFERQVPAHASGDLASAVAEEAARRAEKLPLRSTTPRIEPRRPAIAAAAAFAGIVLLGLVAPERAQRSWRTLVSPALAAPPVRLEVEPGSVRVSPGASLAVRTRVWGTDRRPEIVRPGQPRVVPAAEGAGPNGEHLWRFDLAQLTRDQTYRVRVASTSSPAYRIALAGEPSAVSFDIEYRAPGYARLPVQRGSATRGDLSALRGTRARIVATFDRDLTGLTADLPGHPGQAWTPITPRRWSGEVPIAGDGEYTIQAEAASGHAAFRYRISALADAPPMLAVQAPVGDMDLPAGQQIPLAMIGQDDLGLARLRLEIRKGDETAWSTVPLAAFGKQPREASLQTTWDAARLGLLPGQTALLRFVLEDNNVLSGPGRAVSPTYELRFPGLADLYEQIDRDQGSVHQTLEKAAEQAKEVQKSLDQLARQPRTNESQSPKAFERSEELKSALQRQQEIGKKIDQAVDQLRESLEQAAEREAFNEDLMRKLHEMSELMRQIQSSELRDALRRMQEAMQQMDQQQLEKNLPEWRQQNKEMVQQLQRTIDLLKQLRQEERLDALAKRAQELKQQQDALNHEMSDPQKKADDEHAESLAKRQEEAAERTDKLSEESRQLAAEMEQQERQGIEEAAQEMEQNASPNQRQAAQSAQNKESQKGEQQGKKASESLQKAAESLSQMAQAAQARRRELDLAAVRRAAQDLVSLQRESEMNAGSEGSDRERADRQTDLSEGVARVADSLSVLAKQQPFITPKLGQSLGQAMKSLSESGRQLATGNPARGEQAGREGSQALNEAILELRVTENECQNPGPKPGSKNGGRGGQMVSEMGEKQSQLNQQTRNLSKRLSEQMRLSAGDQEQVRQLAEQQRRLREQIEQIQRDEDLQKELLGRLDGAKRDMQEAEEALRGGDLGDELEQQQQRILSRLLDAQRSVNRRDFDPQRESRAGEDVARASAPELPADLFRETDRLRLDLLKAESDRYPAQYRAYIETYLRSLNQQRSADRR